MKTKIILACVFLVAAVSIPFTYIYQRDKHNYYPKLWLGYFDYRLNLRDLGESLNQCLNKKVFATDLVYRSNRYFSGWSCTKIHNPEHIYSLNYDPRDPHEYFCNQDNGTKHVGVHYNTDFMIDSIENFKDWKNPVFKKALCEFFENSLQDLANQKNFLFHCTAGRDRTGTFAAMLTMLLAEQKHLNTRQIQNAIECDYEKTSSLGMDKKGRMLRVLQELQYKGGVTSFINDHCHIPSSVITKAADNFILTN